MKSNNLHHILRVKLLCVLWLSVLLFGCLTICASALDSQKDFIVENYNLTDGYYLQLGEKINEYAELDTSPEKAVSKSVTAAINIYRGQLMELQTHKEVGSRLLQAEADAAFAKGQAAGRVAWIYHLGLLELHTPTAQSKVLDKYTSLCTELAAGTDAAVINARADGMCTELNRTVYKEMMEELKQSEDSIDSTGLIEAALRKADITVSPDLNGNEFKKLYTELVSSLNLQRCRDRLTAQLKAIFPIIRGGENYTNETTAMFGYALKNATQISAMNEALRAALEELIESPSAGRYYQSFTATLNSQISEEVSRASHNEQCAEVTFLFDDYKIKSNRAKAKDRIFDIIGSDEGEAAELEQRFNGNDGIIDSCSVIEHLDLEVIRATHLSLLLNEKQTSLERLKIFLGSYTDDSFEARISEAYNTYRQRLLNTAYSSISFEASCNTLLNGARAELKSILNEAKAERFLLDHKTIILKPREELELGDEIFLSAAIEGYISLEAEVKEILQGQIKSIAEKYKAVVQMKVRALSSKDVFYLDLCDVICEELKNLPLNSIDVFYNNCKFIFKKAQALDELVKYYRSILSQQEYSNYNSAEQGELRAACTTAARRISALELSTDPTDKLTVAIEGARVYMDQIHQCARVRIATLNSDNLEIQTILADAKATIKSCSDKLEMESIAEKAIFKINRELTKDEIALRSDKYEHLINKMKFLTAEEKLGFSTRIKALRSESKNDASLSDRLSVLEFVWNGFSESLEKIFTEATATDVVRARESYGELFDKECEGFSANVSTMLYISSARCDEFLNLKNSISAKLKAELAAASDSERASEFYAQALEQLNSLRDIATNENLEGYKLTLYDAFEKIGDTKDNYSVENYNKIQELVKSYTDKIKTSKSFSECKKLFEKSELDIQNINTLLDDAKDAALSALNALLTECRQNAHLYSAENMQAIEGFYSDTTAQIRALSSISQASVASELLKNGLSLMEGVRKDTVYSSKAAEAIKNSGVQYPANYNITRGYWAALTSKNGILPKALFSIKPPQVNTDLSVIRRLIRSSAKSGEIKAYGSISEDTLKLLKKCVVSAELSVELSECAEDVNAYTVTMLLPSEIRNSSIIGIVFVDENNNVEFYNANITNSLLSFDFSHFSSYYIVSENTINLTPLIIFLTVLLIFELLALALVALLYYQRKRKENDMFPLLPLFAPNVFSTLAPSLLKIEPANGVGLTVLLTVAVAALGCALAFFAKAELGERKKEAVRPRYLRRSTESVSELKEQAKLPQKQKVAVLSGGGSGRLLKEAEASFVDIEIEEEFYSDDTDNECISEDKYIRRAEINIDSISEQFEAGDLVTLDALKKKRLVSKRTDYVKILARGSLTKPLIIEAQDFSRAAEEMLRAVGGEAIRVK